MQGFTPTHVIPTGGSQAWATPDPSQPVVATIEARVEVVVREERGAWAEVLCNNGWSAWVDGRRLVPIGAAQPAPPPQPAYQSPQPQAQPAYQPAQQQQPQGAQAQSVPPARQLDVETVKRLATPPVVGAAVLLIGTFLPWVRGGGESGNGWDVALGFLFDYKRGGNGGIKIGLILFLLAIGGGYLASQAALQRHRVWVGGAAGFIMLLFLLQMQRLMSAFDQSLFDVVGFGILVCIAGAAALAAAPLQWPKRS